MMWPAKTASARSEPARSLPAARWTDSYRVDLLLHSPAEYDRVLHHCKQWIVRRARRAQRVQVDSAVSGGLQGPHRLWQRREYEAANETLTVELGQDEERRVSVSVTRVSQGPYGADTAWIYTPAAHAFMPPTLVPALVREFGAWRDFEVLLSARVVDTAGTGELGTYLENPERTTPVVVVSRTSRGATQVSPSQLAQALVGLAHVFVFASARAAPAFEDVVGPGLTCSDGAVRLYAPGIQIQDDADRHPLWTDVDIVDAASFPGLVQRSVLRVWREGR